ncbi:hypothetical protein WJX82_003079 [Trebouxia sp. C0006]
MQTFGTSTQQSTPSFELPAASSAPAAGSLFGQSAPSFGLPVSSAPQTAPALVSSSIRPICASIWSLWAVFCTSLNWYSRKCTKHRAAFWSFSFGSVETQSSAPSTPAPGGSTPASTAPAASSQPAGAGPPPPLQPPSQIKGKNVKSIIDDWNSELQAQSRAFVADAQGLADWDKHIRLKRRELLEMEANLNRVARSQEAVNDKLHMLEMHQKETHDSLLQMEKTASSMYQDEKNQMNEDDTERDNLYARAESISAELGNMTLELKACIENVNFRSGSGQGDASDPLSKIVRILNNQLQALTNVDATTQDVTARLEKLTGHPIAANGFSQLDM